MPDIEADFIIDSENPIETEYTIDDSEHFDCSFEIFASGTTFVNIEGSPYDNEALAGALNDKAATSTVEELSQTVTDNYNTLDDKIDTHIADKSNPHEVTKAQVGLGNVDNTSDLNKPISTATQSALNGKQNTISDLSEIRSNAENGQSAYTEIQSYGDIVTYNADNFATSIQGGLADTALQPNDNITELNNNAGYITSADLPTVNNSKITIQKNSTDVGNFNLNQSTDKIINLTVPTQASDINAVPTSRKINNNALSSDISLTASDVGALPSTTSINDLTSTAQQNALNSGATSTNISQIGTNASNISDIQDLIPTEATSTNQLADKNFVNSSVATNTANFIGTFQSVTDLEAYSGTLTNNDYAFVETTDTAGNTLFDRYKYTTATTPASWQYEYELNNSSFTATQWSAINSGANSTNIGQIATNTNDIQSINTTIGGYGNIVTHNTSEFATSVQGGLADTALQPNDSISLLTNDSGYITGINSNDVISALGYTPYDDTNPDGYITSINSSDVTNALGYTPYDSSNPNGYTSNAGTVTSVNNILPVSGNVTLSIPTVNDGILTITQNGTSKGTFSANQAGNDTISLTDTTYNAFTGADSITGGASGLVPAPNAGDEGKFLKGDGTWDSISGANTDLSNLTATGEAHFQEPLVSGTNIKTINSNSILGSGNIVVPEAYIATYNTTSFDDIKSAYDAGKTVYCSASTSSVENLALLSYMTSTVALFITMGDGLYGYDVMYFKATKSGNTTTWTYASAYAQISSSNSLVTSTRFDGQWTYKYSELTTATSTGSRTHSLSTYLPNATYDYEVLFYVHVTSTSSTTYAIGREASPYTNATSANCAAVLLPTGSNGSHNDCTVIYKISKSNQNVYSQVYNAAASSTAWIRALAYRRLGTNS